MYASIDAVSDRLARKLLQYKERRLSGFHGGPNMGENLAAVLDSVSESIEESETAAEENFVDPEAPVVTKIKRYVNHSYWDTVLNDYFVCVCVSCSCMIDLMRHSLFACYNDEQLRSFNTNVSSRSYFWP